MVQSPRIISWSPAITDPLADVVSLLQPRAPFSKLSSGAGRWAVHRAESGRPFYCAILEGTSRLAVEGQEPLRLERGDFVLVPSATSFTSSSLEPPRGTRDSPHYVLPNGEFRLGKREGPPDVRMLVGYCEFASTDASLLVGLLPRLVLVRGKQRLATLMQLVQDEFREQLPGRDVILARLLEVLLIEALRATSHLDAPPGLLRGLADTQIAVALRCMHGRPSKPWSVSELAREAGLSRSAFFERFSRALGVAPMEYLLSWRMALAKDVLLRGHVTLAEVAERIGYGSASAFSVAFTRHVGVAPGHFARKNAADRQRGSSPAS